MRKFYLMLFGAMLAFQANAQTNANGFRIDSLISTIGDGSRLSKTTYEYNAEGHLTVMYTYVYNGGAEVLNSKSQNVYDDNGILIRGEGYEYQNGDWVLTSYDENSEFDAVSGQPSVVISYAVDSANPALGIQPTQKSVTTKFHGVAVEDAEVYSWDGAQWVLAQRIHYDFGDSDLPVGVKTTISMYGIEMVQEGTMEYDDHGQILRSSTIVMGIANVQEYENTYDSYGNLIKQVLSSAVTNETLVSNYYWSKPGATALHGVSCSTPVAAYYDLHGHRLSGRPTKQGIYIHDGRKVIVK